MKINSNPQLSFGTNARMNARLRELLSQEKKATVDAFLTSLQADGNANRHFSVNAFNDGTARCLNRVQVQYTEDKFSSHSGFALGTAPDTVGDSDPIQIHHFLDNPVGTLKQLFNQAEGRKTTFRSGRGGGAYC